MSEIVFLFIVLLLAGINIVWALTVVLDRPIRFVSWGAAVIIVVFGVAVVMAERL